MVEVETIDRQAPVDPRGAWSPGGLARVAVILSLFPAAILHALNYERLGCPELKRPALARNLSGVVIGYIVAAVLLEEWATVWILVFTIAGAIYFQNSQYGLYERHLRRGGKRAPIVTAALGWLLFSVAILVIVIAVVALLVGLIALADPTR